MFFNYFRAVLLTVSNIINILYIPYIVLLEMKYFTTERGCMIDMRARKLIESKCDKLALNFISEALRVIRSCTDDHLLRRTVSLLQHQCLHEMYYSLLYKFKESTRLKVELEAMELESAKEFILHSFATIDAHVATNDTLKSKLIASNAAKKDPKQSHTQRLHKYQDSVSQYALQLILVRILSGEYGTDGLDAIFKELLTEWIRRNKQKMNFDELFQKLIQTAVSNSQIYDCCEILYELVSPIESFVHSTHTIFSRFCSLTLISLFVCSFRISAKSRCVYFVRS